LEIDAFCLMIRRHMRILGKAANIVCQTIHGNNGLSGLAIALFSPKSSMPKVSIFRSFYRTFDQFNGLLGKQLRIRREPSTNIVILLILNNKSRGWLVHVMTGCLLQLLTGSWRDYSCTASWGHLAGSGPSSCQLSFQLVVMCQLTDFSTSSLPAPYVL
jgi:hypothetical protein